MRILMSAIILAAATAVAVPASAQGTGSSSSTQKKPATTAKPVAAKPKAPKPKIGYRAFFVLDTEMMTASDSFRAVTGSSTLIGYGGGGDVLNLWQKVFVRGSFAVSPTSGERAYVLDGTVIPTGVGIDIGLSTIEIGAGWRMPLKKHPKYAPYVGGGVLFVKYTEKSEFATSGDDVNESFTGYSVQGGLDAQLSKRMNVAVEGQYRIVPDAFGTGGVAGAFKETDLGGFAVRVMVGVSLTKKK